MTNLTEQWKKGELPEGFYYIKVKEEIANYPLLADCVEGLNYTYFLDYEDYVQQVLAPVPSYNEWTAAQEQLHKEGIWYTEISHKKVLKENEKLKHTLQKARIHVAIDAEDYEDRTPSKAEKAEAKKLLTEIDEVLK